MEELKELELLEEGVMVDIPELENDDLLEENSLSVIVRCLNPSVHKVGGLVKALPPIWGLEDRVHGRGVGPDRVQFIFQSDRDLHHVLTRGPWFVNGWIVALDQWSPTPGPSFLQKILFWIRIKGLPVHLLKRKTIDTLVGPLGKIENVELHAKNSSSVEYVRAQVWINADEPLQFRRIARFKSGEVIPTELEYERLIKICFLCKRLTHDQNRCPSQLHHQGRDTPASNQLVTEAVAGRRSHGGSGATAVDMGRPQPRQTTSRRASKASTQRRSADTKGKSIVGASTRVWRQKEIISTPRAEGTTSKSSGESSVPIGRKSSSGKKKGQQSRAPTLWNQTGN